MGKHEGLAERFEASRGHLRAVAYRMLGSLSDAEDAVQEAWLRLSRADVSEVENLVGWLTTVVGRVCLDMLRTRASRREALRPLSSRSRSALWQHWRSDAFCIAERPPPSSAGTGAHHVGDGGDAARRTGSPRAIVS